MVYRSSAELSARDYSEMFERSFEHLEYVSFSLRLSFFLKTVLGLVNQVLFSMVLSG